MHNVTTNVHPAVLGFSDVTIFHDEYNFRAINILEHIKTMEKNLKTYLHFTYKFNELAVMSLLYNNVSLIFIIYT